MEPWVIFSLIAAFAFGTNVIFFKFGLRGGVNPFLAELFFGAGVLMAFIVAFIITKPATNISMAGISLLLLAGLIWGIGSLAIAYGMSQNYDVSKMSVIYNSNTVITVLLGILVLKELQTPSELWRTLIGGALTVIGVIIISLK
ncbi:EamA family transporter [Candidatus Woesearchaeota archaeon]|nr:EamA family transporter [Candidatus Woesearchaeota archaeon]